MAPRVVLVGAPGSGKSAVAGLLADRWRADMIETDTLVEADAGMSVSDIFVAEGESGFRQRETAAARAAPTTDDAVVVLGSGAVEDAVLRAALTDQTVVFLAVGANEAGKRLGITGIRPAGLGPVRTRWNAMMNQRTPLYAEVATATVSTDNRTPADVADAVAALVEETS